MMDILTLQALCVGADLPTSTDDLIEGRVQACFNDAAHIALADGRLLSMLTGGGQHGMRLVNIAARDWPALRERLKIGEAVQLSATGLQSRSFTLAWQEAQVWNSPQARRWLDRVASASLREAIDMAQSWVSQGWSTRTTDSDFLWQTAYSRFDAVVTALTSSDAALESALRETVGVGPGLTPSGDDMLAGLLIGLQAGSDLPHARRLALAVRRHLADTSPASRDVLDQATRGWVTARLAAVLVCLNENAPPDQLETALTAQCAVGHYSGHDTLIGLFAGLEAALPFRSPASHPHPPAA